MVQRFGFTVLYILSSTKQKKKKKKKKDSSFSNAKSIHIYVLKHDTSHICSHGHGLQARSVIQSTESRIVETRFDKPLPYQSSTIMQLYSHFSNSVLEPWQPPPPPPPHFIWHVITHPNPTIGVGQWSNGR